MQIIFTSPHTENYPATSDKFIDRARKAIRRLIADDRWRITEKNIRDSGTILPWMSYPDKSATMEPGR